MTERMLELGWPIIIGIGVLILLVNLSLIYGLLSGGTRRQIELLRRAAHRARNPWQAEEDAIEDLHRRVQALRDDADPGDEDR